MVGVDPRGKSPDALREGERCVIACGVFVVGAGLGCGAGVSAASGRAPARERLDARARLR